MTSVRARLAACGALVLGLLATEAYAWGPAAQRAIARAAMQRVEEKYPRVFESGNQRYDSDVIAGASDGAERLVEAMNIRTDRDAMEAIGNQILLLREVRKYGVGSYFAYRMGLLSAIVSDVLLPYALDPSEGASEIRAQIERDIDQHVTRFHYKADRRLQVVRNVPQYLDSYRPFHRDARNIIAEDYRSGKGYSGYLSNAAQSFFQEAIQASADVWFTILRAPDGAPEPQPSPETVAWYFVNEMEYLLKVKRNVAEASKKYALLERVNASNPRLYEQVGDLFYAYGSKSQNPELCERGVQEWENALNMPGADRRRLADKLAGHYLEVGKSQAEAARQPGGYKRITDALASFSRSLEYAHENTEAERLLSETRELKRQLDEALETQTRFINSAEQVFRQAEQSERVQDYANAITWYNSSHDLFGKVNNQFPELQEAAAKRMGDIKLRINTIKEEALKRGKEVIAKGDEEREAKRFDEAVDIYSSVAQVLSPITDEPTSPFGKRRDELIAEAENKIRQTEDDKKREEAARAEAAKAAAAGGKKPGLPRPGAAKPR